MAISLVAFLTGIFATCAFFSPVENKNVVKYREFHFEHLCRSNASATYNLDAEGTSSVVIFRGPSSGFSTPGKHCNITIRPPPYHGVILTTAMRFGINPRTLRGCPDDHMVVTDSNGHSRNVCGYIPADSPAFFISNGELRLTVRMSSLNRVRIANFSLTATTHRREYVFLPCNENEFRCNRRLCIWKGLRRDGVNNCGDSSDEETNGFSNFTDENPMSTTPTFENFRFTFADVVPNRGGWTESYAILAICLGFVMMVAIFRVCFTRCNEPSDRAILVHLSALCNRQNPAPPPYTMLYDDDDDNLILIDSDEIVVKDSKEKTKPLEDILIKNNPPPSGNVLS